MGKVYQLYRGGVPQEIKKEEVKEVMEVKESAEKDEQTQEIEPQETEKYPESREELISLLKQKEAEAKENRDRMLRYAAEVENLKKSFKREKEEYFKYILETFIKEFLPFVDNLERALEAANQTKDIKTLTEGIELTLKGLFKTFEKFGLKQFEAAIGESFQPEFHEALMVEETHEYPEGTIVRTFQKGYTLHNRVIRPALVSVAKKPSEKITSEEASSDENKIEERREKNE